MLNQYTGIADYYDLLMQAGYYDHNDIAKSAQLAVGKGGQVLEIGVGTGLFAESYVDSDAECEFTGIDFTPSMLTIAKQRLGDRVNLIEGDVLEMDLKKTFDAIISSGGVWLIINGRDGFELGSHILDLDANRRGLENLARHVRKDGILLLSRQPPHQTLEKSLSDGITYSQSIELGEETSDYYFLVKNYFFKRGEEILAQERLSLVFFKLQACQQLLENAGFEFYGTDDSGCWVVCKKR